MLIVRGTRPFKVEPTFIVEEVTDPAEIARAKAQDERLQRNLQWIQEHWEDVLPHGFGKFLAVAGQEAFLGDSAQEAWALAKAAHPEDDGAFIQYLMEHTGPRIYAYRR
jgi:hypothetical protein